MFSTLSEFLARSYTSELDVTELIADYAETMTNQALLSDPEKAALDSDGDGTLTVIDRDWLVNKVIKERFPTITERLPWNTSSHDPLSLAGTNVLIIDPSYASAVNVTAGTNNCTFAVGGGSAGALFSGDTYLRTVFYGFSSFNELGSLSIRRFPTNGGRVIVYVRGGTHLFDQEIRLVFGGTGSWTEQTDIVFRCYPGEYATVEMQNSHTAGTYNLTVMWTSTRANVTLDDLQFFGRAGTEGAYIFAPYMFSFGNQIAPYPVTSATGTRIVRCSVENHRAIPPGHDLADDYPDIVDSKFNNRTSSITSGTNLHAIQISADNVTIEDCDFEFTREYWPYQQGSQVSFGEGIDVTGDSVTIRYCRFTGGGPHSATRFSDCINGLVEFCDYQQVHHTCLLLFSVAALTGTGFTVRYNRVHNYGQTSAYEHAGIETGGISDSSFYGNVIWNDGLGAPDVGLVIGNDPRSGYNESNNNKVYRNVFYKTTLLLGYFAGVNTGYNKIKNNVIYDNVFVDLPSYNAGVATSSAYNAQLRINLADAFDAHPVGAPTTNDFYGNQIIDNVFWRPDGGKIIGNQYAGASTDHYTVDQLNSLDGCARNRNFDPRLINPANGDLRFDPLSRMIWLDRNTPLAGINLLAI